jgi:hypothetical protein
LQREVSGFLFSGQLTRKVGKEGYEMPQPTSSLATLRPDLGGSLEEFNLAEDRLGFIGSQVLPTFEVGVQSGTYGQIPLEQLLKKSGGGERAPGSAYDRGKWKFEEATFATQEYGHEEPVDDRESAMYREFFDAEMVSAERARDRVLRNREVRIAAAVFNATTWSAATTAVTNEWDDFTNATPITDVRTASDSIYAASGLRPNALVINFNVFRNLKRCDEIIDSLTPSTATLPGDMGIDQLRRAFELPLVIVAGASKNTSIEGATPAVEQIWSDEYAMVARICTTNDIREACLGRTFHWAADGSDINAVMESYRDETVRADIIRARMDVQEKITLVQAGHLLSNITT